MSKWINIKRITKSGIVGFLRNGFVSATTVLIMTITLFVIGSILMTNAALSAVLTQLQNKVDINVYFLTDAPEDSIFALQASVEALPEVASVEYISRDEALENFRTRHEGDQLTLQALDELGENPLGASLAVRAKETSQYEGIAKFLESKTTVAQGESSIIEKVNYSQNKSAIDKLTEIIDAAKRFGFAASLFLAIASLMIVFNTIRLAIYTTRDEIGVMRLVGASDSYVQGPFIVEGALYGVASAIIAILILLAVSAWLAQPSASFFGSFNTLEYFSSHTMYITASLVGMGILLGIISSFFSVRRYLKRL